MRSAILTLCILVAAGVFVTMFLAIWSTRRDASRPASFHQSLAAEFVWAAIPCLMLLAAAIPAILAITSQGDH
jgi:heme/copper-type cytochrome/quinol oxidase subunit 2